MAAFITLLPHLERSYAELHGGAILRSDTRAGGVSALTRLWVIMTIRPDPSLPADEQAHDVVIVGAGFGGIGMAIRLKQAGHDDFIVLEQASEVGGTWRDNTYPGCACDIPADLYSFSFATDWDWSRRYPTQAEIQAYLLGCVARYGVGPHLRLGTALLAADFDVDTCIWRLRTSSGAVTARVLILAMGALHRPAWPAIQGQDQFLGAAFHSARWDHGVSLTGRHVAVIGTGASAIQLLPPVADQARSVTLFQRTPAWILPKHDPSTSGLGRSLRRHAWWRWFTRARTFWAHESRALGFVVAPWLMRAAERRARGFAKRQLTDARLRERVTPDYTIGCKRVLLSNDFLPALNRPHVHVVSDPITRILPDGVLTADGVTHRADVLVYATGFQAADPLGGLRVTGRRGLTLDQTWADGMHAWLGLALPGFPNLYFLGGPNTGLGHNSVVFMLEAQIDHVLCRVRSGVPVSEVRAETAGRFRTWLDARMRRTVWLSGCRSWYLDRNGRNTTLWPGFCVGYWWRTRFVGSAAYHEADRRAPADPSS